jgi:hypothetical protein
MKCAIALLGLGLAMLAGCSDSEAGVVGVAEAQSSSDLSFTLSGSNLVITTENGVPTPPTQAGVSYGSGITKGSGSPIFVEETTFGTAAPDDRCTAYLPYGADLTSNIVLTYNDGSILQLSAGEGSFFCSDGVVFDAELQGTVAGGEGRFDGASGAITGSVEVDGSRLTGNLTVDLD